jgi:lysylphosphatidylglycerol synthetase-like protein (DUF2156 family)
MAKYYSDLPARRTRQITGDLWLVGWTILWIWVAVKLHGLIMNLAAPGLAISDGAGNLATSIDSAGESIGGLPLVGDTLTGPFNGMSDAASAIASAGQTEADAVAALAMFLSVSLAVLAFASFAAWWLPIRYFFVRRASAAQRFVDLHVLARIHDDPAGSWRRGDRMVIDALAELELREEGLRMPAGRGFEE